jgi:hypothetical protein
VTMTPPATSRRVLRRSQSPGWLFEAIGAGRQGSEGRRGTSEAGERRSPSG